MNETHATTHASTLAHQYAAYQARRAWRGRHHALRHSGDECYHH